MTIGEYLKRNDIETYKRLKRIGRKRKKKDKGIKLGDRPEKLMQHDAYRRIGRRIRQIKWG